MTSDEQINLTPRQIAEAFPEELKTIVPRLIRQHKSTIREFDKAVKTLMRRHYSQFDEMFAYEWLKIQYHYKTTWYKESPWDALKRLESYVDSLLPPPPEPEGKFNEGQIERARNKPLQSIYSFEKIKRNGQRYITLCPFHTEKSGSFIIYSNNSYHCFGCQANGQNAIDFLIQLEQLSFVQAVSRLQG